MKALNKQIEESEVIEVILEVIKHHLFISLKRTHTFITTCDVVSKHKSQNYEEGHPFQSIKMKLNCWL